jgi:serine/threonine protein kinase
VCVHISCTNTFCTGCFCNTSSLLCFTTEQCMQRGSLRSVLNTAESWQQYTPVMRHQILCDVTEALTYLHGQNVFHRDQKVCTMAFTQLVLNDYSTLYDVELLLYTHRLTSVHRYCLCLLLIVFSNTTTVIMY